jgi:hypothetical protein
MSAATTLAHSPDGSIKTGEERGTKATPYKVSVRGDRETSHMESLDDRSIHGVDRDRYVASIIGGIPVAR